MIQLQDLTKSFGDRVLLDHVTWQISDRERVGLCGANGVGKTTLLRMMAGFEEVDSGAILKPSTLTVGYVEWTPDESTEALDARAGAALGRPVALVPHRLVKAEPVRLLASLLSDRSSAAPSRFSAWRI